MTGSRAASELADRSEREREYRAEAEAAAERLETAWQLAGLPSDPGWMPRTSARGIAEGPLVGVAFHARVANALADVLTHYARLTGQLVDGETLSLLAHVLAGTGAPPALPRDGYYVVPKELSA